MAKVVSLAKSAAPAASKKSDEAPKKKIAGIKVDSTKNIIYQDTDDYFILKFSKKAPLVASSSGKSLLLASSKGLRIIEEQMTGDSFKGKVVGLSVNVMLMDRKKKAKVEVVEDDEEDTEE